MSRPRLEPAYRLCVIVLRPLMMVLTKRDWRGTEHIPAEGGFVVAPNHISHLDPIAFAHYLYDHGRPPRFLAKSGLFSLPLIGWVVRNSGQIPVVRESRDAAEAFRGAVDAVKAGKCVAIYPEGTITRQPDGWPMVGKTGAARVALTTGCPIVPVAQWGPQALLPQHAKRPRVFPRKTMQVTAGPPVDLDDLRGRPITPEVLRTATERVMARVTELLEEIRGESAPAVAFDPVRAGLARTGRPDPRPAGLVAPTSVPPEEPAAGDRSGA